MMRDRCVAVSSVNIRYSRCVLKFTSVLSSFKSCYHLIYQIINIKKLQFSIAVINLNRKIVSYVMTECCNSRIIIRPAPFAEQVRESVYKNIYTITASILKEKFFSGKLAFSVITSCKSSRQGCLN